MTHNTGTAAGTAQTAALAIEGPQPVWMTLNEARECAFTGEIVFEADPEVLAYLDNGIVYYAERASDVSLGRRLLDAGVIDIEQLERGTVRVGDVEHLGRLFDRDPSVDRDAVIVMAETFTEALIADLANRTISTVRVTAYRHHPSGVHRWFVAPLDPAAVQWSLSAVAQLDSTVVDELPGLPFADVDELTIEWDDQIDETDQPFVSGAFDEPNLIEETPDADVDVFALSLDLVDFDVEVVEDEVVEGEVDEPVIDEPVVADVIDEPVIDELLIAQTVDELLIAETVDELFVAETTDELAVTETVDEFKFAVVWPDGSEESAPPLEESHEADESAASEAAFTQSDDGGLEFVMPPLTLSDEPDVADAEVPDDVAAAVRRAIAAIESAGAEETAAAQQDMELSADVTMPLPEVADIETDIETETAAAPAAPAAGLGGFAPPTMATRAEVLYGQMGDDGSSLDASLVDDAVDDDSSGGERSSALRRLIGSLRRKDH